MERKKIAGRAHKRVQCSGCGEWIWVRDSSQKNHSCNDCYGYSNIPLAGRGGTGCKQSDRVYQGDCFSG